MLATKVGHALDFLLSHLKEDGSYGADASDLAASYKSPMLFLRKGMAEEADRVLTYIKRRFLMANGDFGTGGVKTADPVLSQYGSYLNGWIAIAAQRMGRFDVAYPASRYLDGFYREGRFATLKPGDSQSDILTVSHLGLHALYMGQVEKALAAGLALENALDEQCDSRDFFLRFTADGPVTEFAEEATFLHLVRSAEPQQAYFMVGYPIAYLALLYQASGEQSFLTGASRYLDFAARCSGVESFHFSHKVAWGATLYAGITGDERAKTLSGAIVTHLLSLQSSDGGWHPEQPLTFRLDQTAEIALWLTEIAACSNGKQS